MTTWWETLDAARRDEAEADLARTRAEREEAARRIAALGDAGEAYERALAAAAKRAARGKGPASAELREFVQRTARLQRIDRRLARARDAGGRALDGLEEVRAAVGGAERMSVWDLFGGGMVASTWKHARIDAARELLCAARGARGPRGLPAAAGPPGRSRRGRARPPRAHRRGARDRLRASPRAARAARLTVPGRAPRAVLHVRPR